MTSSTPLDITQIAAETAAIESIMHERRSVDIDLSKRWGELLKQGRILFYGTREVEIGLSGIDWSGGHIAHQEWPAQLNRFFVLPHLAELYQHDQDETWPRLARQLIDDWISAHDYGAGKPLAPGDNTLNLSIRLGQSTGSGWWPALAAMAGSAAFDQPFLQRVRESSRSQLEALREKLTASANWRISQLDTMLYCGLTVPGLDAWLEFAVRNLNEAFYRQIHDDGSHEEHTPSYHSWMCSVFTGYWRLGRARPELGLHLESERVARMWDYLVCTAAPDGGSCGLHDSTAWQPGKGLAPLLAKWEAFLAEAGLDAKTWDLRQQPSRWFASAGQAFLRSDWTPEATMVSYDATRWGGGHCHLSRNSVTWFQGGRMLLCDPGIFSYEMSDPFAPYGKSTPAHNTLNLEGLSQSEADPELHRVAILPHAAVISSSYAGGYYPGVYLWNWPQGKQAGRYARHTRTLVWLRDRCALVFDALITDCEGQPYALHWQFPAGPHGVDADQRAGWSAAEAQTNMLVRVLQASDELRTIVYEGDAAGPRGWLPTDTMGGRTPAPQLAFEASSRNRFADLTTLLLPFDGTVPPAIDADYFTCEYKRARAFRLRWADGEETLVAVTHALHAQVGEAGPLVTDAAAVILTLRHGVPTRVTLVDGMYCRFEGRLLLDESSSGIHNRQLA